MAVQTVPSSATPVTRADLVRHFYPIRKSEVAARNPHLRDGLRHDMARAWADLDASAEMQRLGKAVARG